MAVSDYAPAVDSETARRRAAIAAAIGVGVGLAVFLSVLSVAFAMGAY